MSKAFTKEDSPADDELDLEQEVDAEDEESETTRSPSSAGKNYITPAGLARLKAELHDLLTVERPKMVETVAWAASNGDRSENADYQYGKKRLREIDRRIRFLQKRLDSAVLVDPTEQSGDRVLFGATVSLRGEGGRERVYAIVGIDEADAKAGKISWISPLAQALLQAKAGDDVVLRTPRGEEEIQILGVRYIKII